MTGTSYSLNRRGHDHFEPESENDPHEQRRRRHQLEAIDYAAYAANKETMASVVGETPLIAFERLAVVTAQARALWLRSALALAAEGREAKPDDVLALSAQRRAFEELAEAYEGLRRLVERGYVRWPASS